MSSYEERAASLGRVLGSGDGSAIRLAKQTSNLFRDRPTAARDRVDVSAFDHVLEVNARDGWVDVEGMVTYERLVDATLQFGVMPAVVPQLKSITIGGAVAGVGIEATSFRHGLVHESLLAIDVLLPDGRVLKCTRQNEHRELFFGFPNSYGTLGYALRLRAQTIPVKPYVKIVRERFDDARAFFGAIERACNANGDFVDGVIFSQTEMYLNVGHFITDAPYLSDYTFEHIYYRSIREKPVDFMTVRDYLWRWDTDCSGAQGTSSRKCRSFASCMASNASIPGRTHGSCGGTRALALPAPSSDYVVLRVNRSSRMSTYRSSALLNTATFIFARLGSRRCGSARSGHAPPHRVFLFTR